ncbi:prostatic spermine-binding protein-like [Suncus etruscus]|uniref:prostatic spermine-binding protein-like n=1 Tax=Suncus etruscus TaxID=109475 RepID=UPI0021103C14|nr:prostatic spermine-binding protein-like [Suncus etruscus]XP_049624824.1 prostatic spermine-binding protein-like [Suncus etruscus]
MSSKHTYGQNRNFPSQSSQEPTMLLWLSLLLCSGACWAEHIYGACIGQNFNSSVNNDSDISNIQVSFGTFGIMKGIRLKFGDVWGSWYGMNGGSYEEADLRSNEHIVAVSGSRRVYIRSLTFYTDHGRKFSFGTESGIGFMAYPDSHGKVLTGIVGKTEVLGICGIGFKWDDPVVLPTEAIDYNGTDTNFP